MAEIIHFIKHNDHYEFRLSNKPEYLFLCDLEDFSTLFTGSWYVHLSGKVKSARPYIRMCEYPSNKNIHFHRFIMDAGDFHKENIVDHISRDTLDNRKVNLRIVNQQINMINREPTKHSFSHGENHFAVTEFKHHGGKTRYQTYIKGKFIASSFDIEIVKARVIQYLTKEEFYGQERSKGSGE